MAKNVYQLFKNTVAARGDRTAAQQKSGGVWRDVTWNELLGLTEKVSAGLVGLGIAPKERVSVLSNTRLEWCIADIGILGAGLTTVPVYQSSTSEETQFILQDAGVCAIFAEDATQVAKLRKIRSSLPNVKKIIVIDGPADADDGWVTSWDAFLASGEKVLKEKGDEVRARPSQLGPDDILTFIYTSGTTGKPKGTILTHDNMMYEAEAIQKLGVITADDVQYFWLPLAHVFAKVLEVTWLALGHVMSFWERDQKKIVENMGEVRPTVMACVPRIYEKVYAKVVGDMNATAGVGGKIAKWGLAKGAEAAKLEAEGKRADSLGWTIAKKLVFTKVGDKLGQRFGGRLRFFISGGAPLAKDIAFFFKYAGVIILEGYGLTETSAATTVNLPNDNRIGTVGRALPGTELKIASDGEILIKGRGVMRGYWNRDDATKEAIDSDGWFHSGDIGVVDKDGFVRITDRKKDIIVTAGGKNIAPQNLEGGLKAKSPLISQVVVHGDKRNFLSAIITLDRDNLEGWAKGKGIVNGSFDYAKITQHPDVKTALDEVFSDFNKGLASYESVKKFKILDHDFEIGDQLTPSLKVKRKLCNDRYKDIFDGIYAGGGGGD
jgi:long-chain acyl-CoA synthetase